MSIKEENQRLRGLLRELLTYAVNADNTINAEFGGTLDVKVIREEIMKHLGITADDIKES